MPIFIDRRLNPKDKSLGNRQRFLRRAREELKRSLRDQIRIGRIADVDAEHAVPMPDRGTGEPTFNNARNSGRRQYILPGNRHFSPGDLIPKPGQGGGAGASSPGNTVSEDDFRFVLSREEVLDLFFEDLELPDMVKLNLKEILAFKPRRAGFAATGSPTNINVGRTMRNSHGRRIALRRPKQGELDAILEEIAMLELVQSSAATRQRIAALREELDRLERRRRRIAYVDPVDIRFNRFDPQPVPNANAVMFCLMDVSGSMGEREKDLAKRFFVLLHLFLKRRYDRIEIVFIRHTHEAQEVDEETFFNCTQSGGTVVSTALEEMHRIIEQRYPASQWNIYAAQASDGDNSITDSERCIALLDGKLMRLCQYFAYVEIIDEREAHIFGTTENGTSLWRAYSAIDLKWPNFQMSRIATPADIYPVFRQLFGRQPTLLKRA
ncbi:MULTISPECIES: YeaH/YhbH family protein [unclassified Mesorhizobium]|uniref:YeaH/YhbH family protein n=1 Tax=unclassified Mesorhizobium TaxID=325217 RepID=UPI001092A626|nr:MULTISPECIES: YeaH/YhbH family protein [unclassified Mesorhizobium]TGP86275.1 YeaH/YhbH family protein [Mesorhizobium sp. M8A.F.Ca.ET.218.01.1.1]TGS38653.1 YeaH/YhbH family protein [Mesorhizobium sp. M8A.F.Ca.ET.182.01.1.1]TGS77149.1 YeaH/YhbH family protein [Mesorhizobium sp. M8A.F.Ca.ET.181.01.1.1]TGT15058.1 YeaH/YhbH family protein [Mesorhizobium sp. M8A.F.Ca.ET.213.01.1.1]